MKLRHVGISVVLVFLLGFIQFIYAANGPQVTLVNALGVPSYLIMNYDITAGEGNIKNIEMFGHFVSYQKTQQFNDLEQLNNVSFTKTTGNYPAINGNYIYADLGPNTLIPDVSCQSLSNRFNSLAKNITITVRKSTISPNQVSCLVS